MRASARRAGRLFILLAAALAGCAAPSRAPLGHRLVAGQVEADRGPDGNSVLLEAPGGLILVDTGRHLDHGERILAAVRERGRPVAAIVNTHWHLDHSNGNREMRAAFPRAPVYGTAAVEGALAGFLHDNQVRMEAELAAGRVPASREAEVRRFLATMADPAPLRPSLVVATTGPRRIAGRRLVLHVAPFAVTEADLWIHDPEARLVIAGDLVVAEVPFFDTACPQGWRRALDEMASLDFDTLIPGHGAPMDRESFFAWRAAFDRLLDCSASSARSETCVAGWRRDAGRFIAPERAALVEAMAAYYVDRHLRAPASARERYCRSSRQASRLGPSLVAEARKAV